MGRNGGIRRSSDSPGPEGLSLIREITARPSKPNQVSRTGHGLLTKSAAYTHSRRDPDPRPRQSSIVIRYLDLDALRVINLAEPCPETSSRGLTQRASGTRYKNKQNEKERSSSGCQPEIRTPRQSGRAVGKRLAWILQWISPNKGTGSIRSIPDKDHLGQPHPGQRQEYRHYVRSYICAPWTRTHNGQNSDYGAVYSHQDNSEPRPCAHAEVLNAKQLGSRKRLAPRDSRRPVHGSLQGRAQGRAEPLPYPAERNRKPVLKYHSECNIITRIHLVRTLPCRRRDRSS
jgi:hypothetical protein